MELTFGQLAVGLTFNPSGDENVNKVKQLYADIIDNLNDIRIESSSPEVKRLCSVGITEAQGAQMWAVKAITWKEPVYVPVNWDAALKRSETKPVLVEFSLETCAPCVQIAPMLKKLCEDKSIEFLKIDSRKEADLSKHFNVRGVPRIILFFAGKVWWDANNEWPGVLGMVQVVEKKIDQLMAEITF